MRLIFGMRSHLLMWLPAARTTEWSYELQGSLGSRETVAVHFASHFSKAVR